MALFSWFVRKTNINSTKNKVRSNTVIQQQEYVNAASHLKKETKFNTLKEHIN